MIIHMWYAVFAFMWRFETTYKITFNCIDNFMKIHNISLDKYTAVCSGWLSQLWGNKILSLVNFYYLTLNIG